MRRQRNAMHCLASYCELALNVAHQHLKSLRQMRMQRRLESEEVGNKSTV